MFEKNVTKENYKLQYLNDFKGLLNLENKTEINLMHILWRDAWNQPDKQLVTNKELKQSWADELNCSLGTVNNTLTKLVSKKLIESSARSTYHPNTQFFFSYSGQGDTDGEERTVRYIIK